MQKMTEYVSIGILCISAIVLIALQNHFLGWLLLLFGLLTLVFSNKEAAKNIVLLYISLAILGITPISTNISIGHLLQMGFAIGVALVFPFLISRYVYKNNFVTFKFHHGRHWYRIEILYIFFAGIVSYLFIPFFMRSTGSYVNWKVEPGVLSLITLFIGTNVLGIWDELFFVNTVFGILRKYLPFFSANIAQSIMFTSFLYELGFRGWGFIIIFLFAFLQGYIFKKTESLFYIITIHLTLDLFLYLALIHAYYPNWIPIFIIK